MSIITEALKKAQKSRFITKKEAPPARESAIKTEEPLRGRRRRTLRTKRDIRSRIKLFLGDKQILTIYIVFVVLLVAIAAGLLLKFNIPEQPALTVADTAEILKSRESALEPTFRDVVDEEEIPYGQILPTIRPAMERLGKAVPRIETIAPEPEVPTLVLNGIMYSNENPQAIINNGIVEEGDVVSGATVVKIDNKKALLLYNDEEIVLTLKK